MSLYDLLDLVNEERRRHGAKEAVMGFWARRHLTKLREFIREHRLDAEHWVRAQHIHAHCPALRALYAPSALPRYREWTEGQAAHDSGDARRALAVQDDIDHARSCELSPLAEQAKRVYAGDPQLCRAQSLTLTLGFNPASPACRQCPQGGSCLAGLPKRVRDARRAGVRSQLPESPGSDLSG